MTLPDDQVLVIFGASGDLTNRKLLPALFELFLNRLLPERFLILGVARTECSDMEYREQQKEALLKLRGEKPFDQAKTDAFLQLVYYTHINTDDLAAYSQLKERLLRLRQQHGIPDKVIYYLATPPTMYERIPAGLQKYELNKTGEAGGWRRIIVEKPFGSNLESALQLNAFLMTIFNEQDIYRIDHYLGKETVQNILVLRFSNGIFEPLWNRNYIDHVDINVMETLGVENRGRYYEKAGAMRDMVQNHLMHLMAFIAMESPAAFDAESLRDEIVKVFRSLHPASGSDVIRAQYTNGSINGKDVPAYRSEKEVEPGSNTETYVAMKFFIDNWRWSGVPFYVYTGKRLPEKKTEIAIHFKSTPHHFFSGECQGGSCNKLIIRIQPDEGISLKFGLKIPGAGFKVKQTSMDFSYSSLSDSYLADAYERLLLDAMQGDSMLYNRSDAMEASWKFIDPVLQEWASDPEHNLFYYSAGSNGPDERTILTSPKEADIMLDDLDDEGECIL